MLRLRKTKTRSDPSALRVSGLVRAVAPVSPVGLALCFLALGLPVWSQNAQSQRIERISNNTGKIVVTVKTDREVYFPGEVGRLTITVQNPTATDLEIWKPFVGETGTVVLLKKHGLEYGPVSPGPDFVSADCDAYRGCGESKSPLPTEVIPGGDQLTKTLWFYDKGLGETRDSFVIYTGAAPWAGDYRVDYWGKSADFRVVPPVFEGSVKINLPDAKVVQAADGTLQKVQLRVNAFVLGDGNRHFVCLERLPWTNDGNQVVVDQQGRVVGGLPFDWYSRFAESEEPIRSLRGESDSTGNLLLTWQQGGEERHLNLARTDWEIKIPSSGQ